MMPPVWRCGAAGLLLLGLVAPALAQPAPGTCERGAASADLDANHVRARLYNGGNLFWNGRGSLYSVPKESDVNAIFAAGIWLGGLVGGELRFAGTAYGPWEYWPGPLAADGAPPKDCADYDRFWSVTRDDLERYEATGEASDDLRDWPAHLGAPVEDGDGVDGNYDLAGGDRPALEGDQTVWWVMNDVGNTKDWSKRPPIPMEVQVTAWAHDAEGPLGYTTFYRYRLVYRGDEPFENAYFGLKADPDLGYSGDDFVGSDTLRDMGFVYNGKEVDLAYFQNTPRPEISYGEAPPAMGYTFVQGPEAVPDGEDNDRDGTTDEPGERHGLSVFLVDNGDSGPTGNPSGSTDDPYQYLQGIWRDGRPMTYGGLGYGGIERTSYMFSGDPVTRSYWSEENTDGRGSRNNPSDRTFLMSAGPFRMEPGEAEEIVFAIVWSRGINRLLSITRLRRDADAVRAFYGGEDYTPPSDPPPPPQVTLRSPTPDGGPLFFTPLFEWESAGDSLHYRLEITRVSEDGTEDTEQVLLYDSTYYGEKAFDAPQDGSPAAGASTAAKATGTPPPEQVYRWRVRAENMGGAGPWSETRTFWYVPDFFSAPNFAAFLTVANAAGPIDPPDIGTFCFNSNGFPCLPYPNADGLTDRPAGSQQATTGARWGIAGGGAPNGDYNMFLARSLRSGWWGVVPYDFEIRFTAEGGYAWKAFGGFEVVPVPFELWDIGYDTPDDPRDDVRLIPYVNDADNNNAFNLVDVDHPVSDGDDDPYTDWIYWWRPADQSPGEAGYRAWEAKALALPAGPSGLPTAPNQAAFYGVETSDPEVMARTVLVNLDAGSVEEGVYNAAMPEAGTVFRIVTTKRPDMRFETRLSGLHVRPAVSTTATGRAEAT